MSDLLSRVIHRASGVASPVEPLLASRYEPQAPAVDIQAAEPAVVRGAEQSQTPAPMKVTKAREVREEDVQEFAEPKSDSERRREEVAPRRAEVQSAAVPVRQAPVRERVMETASSNPTELPFARGGLREIHVETAERTTTDRHTETRVVEKAPTPAAVPARIESTAPQVARSGDIEITIGHIELRMAAPPRPAPQPQTRPRPAQSRLSLDDYLRRRNGGAR